MPEASLHVRRGPMSSRRPRREIAHRLFAVEYRDSTAEISDSSDDMAPTYVVSPTGVLVNRAFVVGVLTDVTPVTDEIYRGRINDTTDSFVAYAGQYQAKASKFFSRAEPPTFVSITAKARTFQPDGSNRTLSSLRPERIATTTPATRQRWVLETARHSLARIELMAHARSVENTEDARRDHLEHLGVSPSRIDGIEQAISAYDIGPVYLDALKRRIIEALEVVFADREHVSPLEVEVSARTGDIRFDALATNEFFPEFAEGDISQRAVSGPTSDDISPAESSDADDVVEAATDDGALSDAEPQEPYEVPPEKREEIESEYGMEFETGTTVSEPADPEPAVETSSVEDAPEPADDTEDDVSDLETTVLDRMRDLDSGDGVERTDLVEAVREETDHPPGAIDDAIQDVLMSGKCYEPAEDRLKPI